MAWNFSADRPVYIQIADRIKKLVLSGEYPAGEQLMTVRQLALTAAVNPNTVQRAFLELEDEGIIVSKGTTGRFVTEDKTAIEACREKMAQQIVKNFVREMRELSVDPEQVIKLMKEESL